MNKLILPLLLIFSISIFSQKTAVVEKKELPVSIYTISSPININGISSVNKRINLSTFKFLFSFDNYLGNQWYNYNATVVSKNLGKISRSFLMDDAKYYFDSFVRKHDPTKWSAVNFKYK